jgi:hypothetical protein
MQAQKEKDGPEADLKEWIPATCLDKASSLKKDYEELASLRPGNPFYDANVRSYIADWKKYWGEYIPELMKTRRVPDARPWGTYPSMKSSITTTASQTYNVMVHSFTPGSFKGVIFFPAKDVFAKDQGALYGEQLSALANGWKELFGGADPYFFYAVPSSTLAPKISKPQGIKGKSAGFEINSWTDANEIQKLMDQAVRQVYPAK